MNTHEDYIQAVRSLAVAQLPSGDARDRLQHVKMTYGIGDGRYRGITHYFAWKNGKPEAGEIIEIAASCEENAVQLAGTTIHELAHVLAGYNAGHGKGWVEAYRALGLRNVKAAGHCYQWANFRQDLRFDVYALASQPHADGTPCFRNNQLNPLNWMLGTGNLKPCPLGIGTRGGKSRGKGSGSRLRLYACQCEPVVRVRVASNKFDATCNCCNSKFAIVHKQIND